MNVRPQISIGLENAPRRVSRTGPDRMGEEYDLLSYRQRPSAKLTRARSLLAEHPELLGALEARDLDDPTIVYPLSGA